MLYIKSIEFPSEDAEMAFIWSIKQVCYDSFYPFKILSERGLSRIDFAPITILYGNNGSGKSTALNVLAEKLALRRDADFNKSNFYRDYVAMCNIDAAEGIPEGSRIITSDDVFDFILNIRSMNENIDIKRGALLAEYAEAKHSTLHFRTMADYEQVKKESNARRKTQDAFVRGNVMDNIRSFSNGESAFKYFVGGIGEGGLYVLDEPENSLSPKLQMELAAFLEDSVRFFGCQIVMSTHSPFLLSLRDARVYDLDANPVVTKKWTALENVRRYHAFFKEHACELDE